MNNNKRLTAGDIILIRFRATLLEKCEPSCHIYDTFEIGNRYNVCSV